MDAQLSRIAQLKLAMYLFTQHKNIFVGFTVNLETVKAIYTQSI